MDKTYSYLYKKLYSHFYKFCISGSISSRDAICFLEDEVKRTADIDLKRIYQITRCAALLDRAKFLQKITELEKILKEDDYENLWYLHSILYLVYQYIYPNYVSAEKVRKNG